MNWLAITLSAYFLLGLGVILDKFLLSSQRVSHPVIFAFYFGTLELFALALFPFGFHAVNLTYLVYLLIAGVIFAYGMFSLFSAISLSEASRVTPVVGAVVPIVVFFLAMIFLNEHLGESQIIGLLALIIGGLWISFDFSRSRKKLLFHGFYWSILAGVLLAVAATLIKQFYNHDNWINVYIWTRLGAFLGVLSFLLVPQWRQKIIPSLIKFKAPRKEHQQSSFIYVSSRIISSIGNIVKEKATSLASVTIVNALVSAEYIFIFLAGLIFSFWLPRVFQEEENWKNVVQKVVAIVIITWGIVLVSGK